MAQNKITDINPLKQPGYVLNISAAAALSSDINNTSNKQLLSKFLISSNANNN